MTDDYLPSLTVDQAREVFQKEIDQKYPHTAPSLYLAELCFSRKWLSDWSVRDFWRARFDQRRDSGESSEFLMMVFYEDNVKEVRIYEI